jgi:hypothetical protein
VLESVCGAKFGEFIAPFETFLLKIFQREFAVDGWVRLFDYTEVDFIGGLECVHLYKEILHY